MYGIYLSKKANTLVFFYFILILFYFGGGSPPPFLLLLYPNRKPLCYNNDRPTLCETLKVTHFLFGKDLEERNQTHFKIFRFSKEEPGNSQQKLSVMGNR